MHSVTPLVPTGLICRETFIFKKGCRFVTFRFFLRRDPSFTNVSLAYILEAFTVCITPLRHSYGLYCVAASLLRSVLRRCVTFTVCIAPLRHSYIAPLRVSPPGIPYHFRAINFPGIFFQSRDFPGNALSYLLV